MTLGYKYACYAKDPTHEYSFNRKADMVVINIGTNDFSKSAELGITSASFSASFKSFIEYVRQKNGDDCIILSLYNMMNDTFGNEICNTIAELGGADNGLYTYFVDRSINEAALNHPSESKYVSYAAELIPLIRSLLDGTYTAPEEYISKLPANSVVVNPAFSALADGTETKFTIGSSEYTVVIGQDAFDNLTQAHNKVNENGTIYLSEGTYSETFYIKKNITIYGPKAGINPNVRGQTETDDWTLNSERGVGEAIITGNWGLGVWGDTVYPDCHKIIIDGVQFSAGVLMRQNSGNAGYCDIKLMNIYATNITTTNQVIFFYPYYPSTSNPNAYARTLKMENFRIEGLVKSFCRLACTSFEASGIYMSEDCSVAFLDALATDKVSSSDLYIIKDSMFRNKNATVFKLNFMSGEKFMDGIGAKSSVTFQIEGCVFAENSTSASSPAVIVIGRNTGNVSVSIKNNMFTSTVSSCKLISDSISAPGDYSKNTVVSGNTFTGIISPFDLTKSTAPIDVSSNTIK
jgi:hypothetical protein